MDARLKGWLVFGLLGSTAVYAIAEEITLATYYPSPRGVYADLRVGGGGPFLDPQGMLQVIKPTATDGDGKVAFRVDDQDDDLTPFVIDEAGNVGIGTASPGQRLHVIGDARIEGAIKAQSFGSFSPLLFKILDVERMRIDDMGNVGIGTASPDPNVKLDVNGAVKVGDSATGAAGALRWNSGQLQVHDGSQWNNVGIPSQVQMTYVSGANPGCPVGSGGFLLRKWSGVSCGSPQCGICSTPNAWLSNTPVCTTAELQDIDGICGPVPCTATDWTEAVCLGN